MEPPWRPSHRGTARQSADPIAVDRYLDKDDPEIIALATSIHEHGLREPIVVTQDGYILSGHRLYTAANRLKLKTVPCRVESIRRTDDIDRFVLLLREYNRQRDKSLAVKLREELVNANPSDAHRALSDYQLAYLGVVVRVVPDGIEPSFPGCEPSVVAVGPRDCVVEWTHRESHPDRRIKSPSRPIIPANERAEMLFALRCVDDVQIFDEDTPEPLIVTTRTESHEQPDWWRVHEPDRVLVGGFLRRYRLPVNRVVFTSHQPKIATLIRHGIELHYDDDPAEEAAAIETGLHIVLLNGVAFHV